MRGKTNNIIRFLTIPVIIILTALVLAVPVSAFLQLPHAFYGNILIDGEPAPVGTKIEARGQGIRVGISGNPIMTSEVGKYGIAGVGTKLLVQGEDIEGNPVISFYINGHLADQSYTWQTGEITRLDLSVTIPASSEDSEEETSSAETSTLQCHLLGENRNVSISDTGEIQESIEISSSLPAGQITVSINAGTKALDNDGNPLTNLTCDTSTAPPPAPENYNLYIAVDFGPDGAIFDPPIIVTFDYTLADIHENTVEKDIVIAYYDSSIGEWVPLASEVDTINHTITASVSHFTTFAILVPQVEPVTEETPPSTPPSTPPASDSEEPAPAATPEPAPQEEPSVSQTPSASGEPESTTDWNLYIIIAAVLVGGIAIAFLIRWIMLHEKRQQ